MDHIFQTALVLFLSILTAFPEGRELVGLNYYSLVLAQYWKFSFLIFIIPFQGIDVLFLFIFGFIFIYFGQKLEIENGTKFLIVLYLFSALITGGFYLLFRLLLTPILPIWYVFLYEFIGLAWGASLGISTFSYLEDPKKKYLFNLVKTLNQ